MDYAVALRALDEETDERGICMSVSLPVTVVRIVEEGEFDAPIDVLWEYLQTQVAHREAHRLSIRKITAKPLSENVAILSMEQLIGGRWIESSGRATEFPSLGSAEETLTGPLAGTKQFIYYTPRGQRTGVTVVADFVSKEFPEDNLISMVHEAYDVLFAEDVDALREFRAKGPQHCETVQSPERDGVARGR